MNKKKEPTSAIAGRMTCKQPRLPTRAVFIGLFDYCGAPETIRANDVIRLSLMLLFAVCFSSRLAGADLEQQKDLYPDYYQQDRNQRIASEQQEQFRVRVPIEHAVGDDVPLAFPKRIPVNNQIVARQLSGSEAMALQGIILASFSILTVILVVRILAPEFCRALIGKLSPWSGESRPITSLAANVREEDEAYSEFLTTFQSGPAASPTLKATNSSTQQLVRDTTEDFHTRAVRSLATQRKLLQDVERTLDDSMRHRMLADLRREFQSFKGEADSPELLPAWQLASALEGLLQQLAGKAGNVTRSTLRTVAGAVDLLQELCKPGVRRDLLSNPPLRFLAVDDDVISRTAVSLALKKAFNQPELAHSGDLALELAGKHAYDAIFLDVQMPGMDGFELCSKIHEIPVNKHTPVIFITCMSDFEARAQSILSGGSDLMGKPFLTFEITVKALTFALARRLQSNDKPVADRDVAMRAGTHSPNPALIKESASAPVNSDSMENNGLGRRASQCTVDVDQQSLAIHSVKPRGLDRSDEMPAVRIEGGFLTRVSAQILALRGLIPKTVEKTDETTRHEMVAQLYLGLHALTPEIDPATRHPALRLLAAIEGLVRKLLENPKHWTSSVLQTISNSLDLMNDLCAIELDADFASNPPIQILVADDEPLSRRAIICALQMTFGKPESVENGESAFTLASQREFDVIFMDVQMPDMDGFTVCSKIRQTATNHSTPVVFVTNQGDPKARFQSTMCGGNDLISKPFLTSEVTVKALTFAFNTRLEKLSEYDQSQSGKQVEAGHGDGQGRRSRFAREALKH